VAEANMARIFCPETPGGHFFPAYRKSLNFSLTKSSNTKGLIQAEGQARSPAKLLVKADSYPDGHPVLQRGNAGVLDNLLIIFLYLLI
jgi:hypothetical protein